MLVCADSTSSCAASAGAVPAPSIAGAGASSSTTCAFVPEIPNEFTPARAGPSCAGHGVAVVGTEKGISLHGMFGFGVTKCRFGGIVRCDRQSVVLMRPAIPAAASVWPMFVFDDPIRQHCSAVRRVPKTSVSAPISTGSPTAVPVPCASTYCTDDGATPARSYAWRRSEACPVRLGVMNGLLLPSLFDAVARITE